MVAHVPREVTRHITGLSRGWVTYSASQGKRNALDQPSQT